MRRQGFFYQGGGTVELKPGGADIAVTHENVVEYIYLFVEARMFGNHLKCLEVLQFILGI